LWWKVSAMPGRRLLINERDCEKGFNRQTYRLEGFGCLMASAWPLGVIARKLQLNHLRKISFFLGINIEVNDREVHGTASSKREKGSSEP
jgi:hypothetical protein